MDIRVQYLEDDIWSVAPAGRVDVAASRSLEEAIGGLLDQGHHRIVVDMAEVSYVASAGLRVLFHAGRRAQTLGGELVIAGLRKRVQEVFDIAGFKTLFQIHHSTGDAVTSLTAGGRPPAD